MEHQPQNAVGKTAEGKDYGTVAGKVLSVTIRSKFGVRDKVSICNLVIYPIRATLARRDLKLIAPHEGLDHRRFDAKMIKSLNEKEYFPLRLWVIILHPGHVPVGFVAPETSSAGNGRINHA